LLFQSLVCSLETFSKIKRLNSSWKIVCSIGVLIERTRLLYSRTTFITVSRIGLVLSSSSFIFFTTSGGIENSSNLDNVKLIENKWRRSIGKLHWYKLKLEIL